MIPAFSPLITIGDLKPEAKPPAPKNPHKTKRKVKSFIFNVSLYTVRLNPHFSKTPDEKQAENKWKLLEK